MKRAKPPEKFARVAAWHISDRSPDDTPEAAKCRVVRHPEPLLTPDPFLPPSGDQLNVSVSIIIGPDGRVESPFVLGGARHNQAEIILHTLHSWRYRPALCNGVPTDSEAVIRFMLP